MAVLGVSGFFATEFDDYAPTTFYAYSHDAAACLVADGSTLAAIEEERLNRDKHTYRFPGNAVRSCIETSGLRLSDISHVAFYFEEEYTTRTVQSIALDDPRMPYEPAREQLYRCLSSAVDEDVSHIEAVFVPHHETHAASAFFDSGFDRSLVYISDGNAERDGISIYLADHTGLRLLRTYREEDSLGHFYTAITKMIGYRKFDEYKVMGLASFGDPSVYRGLLEETYSLGADGGYRLDHQALPWRLFDAGFEPRRATEKITQQHKDLAAAAQEVLERISLHLIRHWMKAAGTTNLCMAGGVAQNTTLNGKLLRDPAISNVYIPAAADDAGAALGAAMRVDQRDSTRAVGRPYSKNAYLGAPLGSDTYIRDRLDAWRKFVEYDEPSTLTDSVATALANGSVIGWAQDRGEFGPRALGNRSILADPRPAENRDRVNLMIKKREDYRPFAPVVTSDVAGKYFDLTGASADFGYMGYVVPVKEEYRSALGAVTHVDGTARVQILEPGQNPKLWALLKSFEAITGFAVLLNTSFNNNAEPIVQSVDDVLATFVTTGLNLAVIGPYTVNRAEDIRSALENTPAELMPFCRLVRRTGRLDGDAYEIFRTAEPGRAVSISAGTAELVRTGARIRDIEFSPEDRERAATELYELWERRLIRIVPG